MININSLKEHIDKISSHRQIKIVAVSKNVTENEVKLLFNQGQLDFGENRVQELQRKDGILNNLDINWHFIGRLQTNKINHLLKIRPKLWQSCSGFEIAKEVDKRANFILPTLLQLNSAFEDSKQGIEPNKAIDEFLKIKQECKNINLCGIMSIGANNEDINAIKVSFETTYKIYENLQKFGANICSMGMSNDYELAIKCGSNMIRLGTILYI